MVEQAIRRESLLTGSEISDVVDQLVSQVQARYVDTPLAIVGIHTRGVVLAQRLFESLRQTQMDLSQGTLDISLYRDDLDNLGTIPSIQGSDLPFDVEGAHILLCDDVMFTGRTIRCALDEIMDYGRPAKVELAVLIDRGQRELPIQPDYMGRVIETTREDHIQVCFEETDQEEGVFKLIKGESNE